MDAFNCVLRRLKDEFKPAYTVRVRFVPRSGYWLRLFGECNLLADTLGRKYFQITIVDDRSMGWIGEQVMIDNLCHEWAHALNWSHLQDSKDDPEYHGGDWGVWYAKVYSRIYRSK